jgi:hypothetical protein
MMKKSEVARCLFCGTMGVWWECSCVSAQKIRDGKLKRPRTVMRDGRPIIIVDEPELLRAARLAGVIRMAEPANKGADPMPVSAVSAADADSASNASNASNESTLFRRRDCEKWPLAGQFGTAGRVSVPCPP